MTPTDLLDRWIARVGESSGLTWLDSQTRTLASDPAALGPAVSAAPRRLGRAKLTLTTQDLAEAGLARPGWDPSEWSLGDAVRVRLLLATPLKGFAERARRLLTTIIHCRGEPRPRPAMRGAPSPSR